MKKVMLYLFVLIIAASPAFAQIASDGLIAYYPFDGNANDYSGNSLNGSVVGATLTTDRNGNVSSAYLFDGENDYIDLGNNSALKPEPPFSIAFWACYYDEGEVATFFLSDYDQENKYYGVRLHVTQNNYLTVQLGDGGTVGPTSRKNETATEGTPSTDQWFHVVATVDASENMSLYIDGELINTTASGTGGDLTYSDYDAVFGVQYSNSNGNMYLHGKLDEFYMFSKVLSEEEIKILADPDIIAFYPMNGNANDFSGNGLDGEVVGAELTTDRNGNANSAYYFDGENDYINLGNSSLLKPALPFSVAFWGCYYDSNAVSTFFSSDYDEENKYYGVRLHVTQNDYLTFQLGNGGTIGPSSRMNETAEEDTPPAYEWFHVAATVDASYNMTLYINGDLISTTASGTGTSLVYSDNDAVFGMQYSNSNGVMYLHGKLDDFLLFDRVLSSDEIEDLADYSTVLKSGSSNLLAGEEEINYSYSLSQNYPNPFNPTTSIIYSIPETGMVTLKVYNTLGQLVSTLVNETKSAGQHTASFDASKLASGIYFYRITSGSFIATKKMMLIK